MRNDIFSSEIEYLVFTVMGTRYGVPHFDVVSVSDIPQSTRIPHMPPDMRGVIPFREGNIPLFDLRVRFGEKARTMETAELVETMAQRKQDHINWLNKLKSEVLEGHPITVQTVPTKCAFGKWYGQFQSDNAQLSAYMARFDQPHQRIHRVAVDAEKLIQAGQKSKAEDIVHEAEKGILSGLMTLFDGVEDLVRRYLMEYSIVVNCEGRRFAIAVDDINFFSPLQEVQYPLPANAIGGGNDLVQAIGRHQEGSDDQMKDVLLLDMSCMLEEESLGSGEEDAPADRNPKGQDFHE